MQTFKLRCKTCRRPMVRTNERKANDGVTHYRCMEGCAQVLVAVQGRHLLGEWFLHAETREGKLFYARQPIMILGELVGGDTNA